MKKAIIFIIVVALVLMLTPGMMYAKPGWGRIQTEWELSFDFNGSDYNHHMTIDNLDPSTGDFSGTGYYKNGPQTWAVAGNISGSNIAFRIDYDSSSYFVDVIGTIDDDGSFMSGEWGNNTQDGTLDGNATYKNHGEVVKNAVDKSDAAKSRDGKPAVSN